MLSKAIGIFDSGVGGLTVVREIKKALPNEPLIYVGDTARIPYGNKSPETIIRYSLEIASFLMEKEIKMLIVACNTASACALPALSQHFDIPILGVIQPGAEKAAALSRNQKIAVLGTKATIRSGAYQMVLQNLLPQSHIVPIACPLFVPLVEEDFLRHAAAESIVREYLQGILQDQIDTILLGCTHYPLMSKLIQKVVGSEITLVDSGQTCAEKAAEILKEREIESKNLHQEADRYFVSDDSGKFRELAERLFDQKLPPIENIEIPPLTTNAMAIHKG